MAGLSSIDFKERSARVAVHLVSAAWDAKISREVKHQFLKTAFEDMALHRIEFGVCEDNERSLETLEHIGATYEGFRREVRRCGGRRMGEHLFSVLASEWPSSR